MARIPQQLASRSLETGPMVDYGGVSRSPVGAALQGLGGDLQAVSDRFQQIRDSKDAFDAKVRENEFNADLSLLEDEAIQKAPADGSGIHDSVYGQIDPRTEKPVRPGTFDQQFDAYVQRMPESKRSEFEAKRELYRKQGSTRLAGEEYKGQQNYYKVELQKSEGQLVNSMLAADPNDATSLEAFKKQGIDMIDASGLPALEKDVAKQNWLAKADETLFQSKLEKDPAFAANARAALGLAPIQAAQGAVAAVVDKIIGVESGGNASAKNPKSSASGLGQFIDSTWVSMIKKHRPDIAAGKSARDLIALKTNGPLSREMTAAYTNDNAEFLTNRGVATTAGNLYLAHFLGPFDAVQALKADPGASVESVLGGDVVRANSFLAGKNIEGLIAWSNNKMGGSAKPVAADPAFANIPGDRRLALANRADVQYDEQIRTQAAQAKADYTLHKDAIELNIVQGGVRDEALISNDAVLNDGDKATLIRSVREQNKGAAQIQADLAALGSGALVLDPYDSDGKKRADNLFTEMSKRVEPDKLGAVASDIIQQTGVVPQPVLNTVRKGLASQSPADVAQAAQIAQRVSTADPAALARRDGGAAVQQAADDFSYFVNTLNLDPNEAGQRLIEQNDPEKKRQRTALEPAAKAFRKEIEEGDELSDVFDYDAVGFNPSQQAGITAEYLAIAESEFYRANGDPELAKNRAAEQMKRLYGVTELTGKSVLMKHPPENYWPKTKAASEGAFLGIGADPLGYARAQLRADVSKLDPDAQPGSVELVTTPQTDAEVKAGKMPGYAVMWRDKNGNYQTIPGQLWRPDFTSVNIQIQGEQQQQQRGIDAGVDGAQQLNSDIIEGRDREGSFDNFLGGPPVAPQPPNAPVMLPQVEVQADTDVQSNLDARRRELFDSPVNPMGDAF